MKRFSLLVGRNDSTACASFNRVGQVAEYLEKCARQSGCNWSIFILDNSTQKMHKVDIYQREFAFGWERSAFEWIEDDKGDSLAHSWCISW